VRPGRVSALLIREGDVVTEGQRLAVIQVEQENEGSESAIGESLQSIKAQRGLAQQQARIASSQALAEQQRWLPH